MALFINIIIGVIMGAGVSYLLNLVNPNQNGPARVLTLNLISVILGGLGSVSADQLLNYGPTILGVNFIPSIVGGIVLSLVWVFAAKKWFHL
ncbi:hypothetical protein [Nicoliella lavandulae]|uniref:Transglycosylase n=1 Tax=Nicoliella lavandulae TaxID=3082954 RepID=A0ABU8SIS3_9LACO